MPDPATPPIPGTVGATNAKSKDTLIVKTADTVDAASGTYKVARGRSVVDGEGKSHGPGEDVSLSEDDAQRMLELGFILDVDGAAIIHADGPAVNVVDGIQVAQGPRF